MRAIVLEHTPSRVDQSPDRRPPITAALEENGLGVNRLGQQTGTDQLRQALEFEDQQVGRIAEDE